MAADARGISESLVRQNHFRRVVASIVELDRDERLADAVCRILPIPCERQARGWLDLAILADGRVRLSVRAGHGKPVSTADPEVDGCSGVCPPLPFHPPPPHE